jgi:hypothetical protein
LSETFLKLPLPAAVEMIAAKVSGSMVKSVKKRAWNGGEYGRPTQQPAQRIDQPFSTYLTVLQSRRLRAK